MIYLWILIAGGILYLAGYLVVILAFSGAIAAAHDNVDNDVRQIALHYARRWPATLLRLIVRSLRTQFTTKSPSSKM